jgi:general secretion pathway protein G
MKSLINLQRAKGFTLIELMVVILIIGVLAALIVPKVMSRPDEARMTAAKSDIATISQALNLYKLDNQRYPTTEQGLLALVKIPTIAPVPLNWKSEGYLDRTGGPRDTYHTCNPACMVRSTCSASALTGPVAVKATTPTSGRGRTE